MRINDNLMKHPEKFSASPLFEGMERHGDGDENVDKIGALYTKVTRKEKLPHK